MLYFLYVLLLIVYLGSLFYCTTLLAFFFSMKYAQQTYIATPFLHRKNSQDKLGHLGKFLSQLMMAQGEVFLVYCGLKASFWEG